MSYMNRIRNSQNAHQGTYKKVLCICSAGQLRSATTALVLSQEPFNYNTRAAGTHPEYALVLLDPVLASWADEFVCMGQEHINVLKVYLSKDDKRNIINLELPDDYDYRDPELIKLITKRYTKALEEINKSD